MKWNLIYVNLVLDAAAVTEKNQPKVILVAIVEQMILISKKKQLNIRIEEWRNKNKYTQHFTRSLPICCFGIAHITQSIILTSFLLYRYREPTNLVSLGIQKTNLINPKWQLMTNSSIYCTCVTNSINLMNKITRRVTVFKLKEKRKYLLIDYFKTNCMKQINLY